MRRTGLRLAGTLAAAALLSLLHVTGAYAGEWTHWSPPLEFFDSTYDESLWYYVKDDGTHAVSEWILDEEDGEWYWLDDTGSLPLVSGIADDGDCYNCWGQWIDTTSDRCWFLQEEDFNKVQNGMNYEEVTELLGMQHELFEKTSNDALGALRQEFVTYTWYSSDMKTSAYVQLCNGKVVNKWILQDLW